MQFDDVSVKDDDAHSVGYLASVEVTAMVTFGPEDRPLLGPKWLSALVDASPVRVRATFVKHPDVGGGRLVASTAIPSGVGPGTRGPPSKFDRHVISELFDVALARGASGLSASDRPLWARAGG